MAPEADFLLSERSHCASTCRKTSTTITKGHERVLSDQSEDPRIWAERFMSVCKASGWVTNEELIAHAAVSLDGEAEVWYDSTVSWIQDYSLAWEEFEEQLIMRFHAPRYAEQLNEALRGPLQAISESVDAYEKRYRCLHAEREALGEGIPLKFLRRYWIIGFRPKFKLDVLKSEPLSLMTRVREAHKIERALALMNGELPAAGTPLCDLLDCTMTSMSTDDMHANMDRLASTIVRFGIYDDFTAIYDALWIR